MPQEIEITLSYYHFDHSGKKLGIVTSELIFDPALGYATEKLKEYLLNYQRTWNELHQDLYPNANKETAFRAAADNLYQEIQQLVQFVLRSSKKRNSSYLENLKKIGDYIESTIIGTSCSCAVPLNNYLMATLKLSPEAFITAQKDSQTSQYVEEINRLKKTYTQLVQNKNNTESKEKYLGQLKKMTENLTQAKADKAADIRKIENKRASRWKLTNKLVDIFYREKRKLEELKNQQNQWSLLEINATQLNDQSESLTHEMTFNDFSQQLLEGPALEDDAVRNLRSAILCLSGIDQFEISMVNFVEKLKTKIIENIEKISSLEEWDVFAQQLLFLEQKVVKDNDFLRAVQESVVEKFKEKIPHFNEEELAKLNSIAEKIALFSPFLSQEIENRRKQYASKEFLETCWKKMLNDNETVTLSDRNVDEFIKAILSLDASVVGLDLSDFKEFINSKLDDLTEKILNGLEFLANAEVNENIKIALRHRLKFANQENTLYTQGLRALRQKIIAFLKEKFGKINVHTDIQVIQRYLKNLNDVLPPSLRQDKEIAEIIKHAKIELIKCHFSIEQNKVHKQYENEIKFLKTGERSLWVKIKDRIKEIESHLTGKPVESLTGDDINYWSAGFFRKYVSILQNSAKKAFSLEPLDVEEELTTEDKQILNEYLQEQVASDYNSVAEGLMDGLKAASTETRRALEKLDHLFKLEPNNPNIDLFMVRYVALSAYLKIYSGDKSLLKAGHEFIHQFQDMAQNESGFVTEIIAKLPLAALKEMYGTWSESPQLAIADEETLLQLDHDLIGKVTASNSQGMQKEEVQLPRYLLLNMVLELIAFDFAALARGEAVDCKLLGDRLAFAIPLLKKHTEEGTKFIIDIWPRLRTQLEKFFLTQLDKISKKEEILAKLKSTLNELIYQYSDDKLLPNLKAAQRHVKDKEYDLKMISEEIKRCESERDDATKGNLEQRFVECQQQLFNAKIDEEKLKKAEKNQNLLKKAKTLLQHGDNMDLEAFLLQLDPELHNLFPTDLAGICLTVRRAGTFLERLQCDSKDGYKMLAILQDLPEATLADLPKETTELLKQLQYRLSNRFEKLMVKILTETEHHSTKTAGEKKKTVINKLFHPFSSETESTPKTRFIAAFHSMDKDAVSILFEQLQKTTGKLECDLSEWSREVLDVQSPKLCQ